MNDTTPTVQDLLDGHATPNVTVHIFLRRAAGLCGPPKRSETVQWDRLPTTARVVGTEWVTDIEETP